MADLNALIAQGAQFKAPVDPFAQYAQMQQLEQAGSTNQLNRMKMEEMQAANTERNALRQLDPTSPDYESQLFKVNPTMGIAYRKEASAAAAQQATQKAQQAEALKTTLANHRSFLVGVNDQPSYDAWRALTIKNIPDLASILPAQFSPDTKDGLLKTADDMSKRLTAAPPTPTNLANLIRERNALPQGDPNRKLYDQQISDLGAANRNAQDRLSFDRAKFAWEKANPTKTIQDDGTGLVAVDTKTGIATPVVYGANGIQTAPAAVPSVTVDGRSFPGPSTNAPTSLVGTRVPSKPKAIPEAYAKQAMGVLNTNDALQTLQDVTQKFTAADMVDPVKRAQIGQAHATTLLFAKEMFNLGVLNGGDERIVNSVINNPIDFSSSIIPIEAIRKQARDLQDVVERTNKNLSTVYKLPPQELKRTSPASGSSDVRSAADNILKGK